MKTYLRHRVRVAGQCWITTYCGLCFLVGSRHAYTTHPAKVTCRRCRTLQRLRKGKNHEHYHQ